MNIFSKIYCRTFQGALRAALPVLPYASPVVVNKVTDVVDILKEKNLNKVLILTDKGVSSLGLLDSLKKSLKKSKVKFYIYDEVVSNPTIENVEEARAMYIDNGCNVLIGFGGGSSIDCAKAVGARIVRKDKPVAKMGGILKVMKKIPFLIAIPTTAGTGSETTLATVITDEKTRHKFPINDFSLIPKVAVLDPKLTKKLSKSLTATTGMDALTHAVEAFIGRSTTKGTRSDAIMATKLILDNIEKAYNDGNDMEARENMLKGAFLAGRAFSKSYVGYCHAVAHTLGGKYNTSHGLVNAVLLPYVLESYGSSIYKKIKKLAVNCGLVSDDCPQEEATEIFIKKIRDLNKKMNIPDKIEELKEEDIYILSIYAEKEANPLYPVPKLMTREELEKLYYCILVKSDDKDIARTVEVQRNFFNSGATLSVKYRKNALKRLRAELKRRETDICDALKSDLGKSEFESYMCEVGLTISEINYMLKHMGKFAKEKRVCTPLAQFDSRSYKKPMPYGVTLVMSPWNYPLLLSLDPLVDAIAAGNTVVLKPSAYSPATSQIIKEIIESVFDKKYVAVVMGGREENSHLLEEKFDYIFFTGSKSVGSYVLEKAAKNVTPVTLELGGKSPCIIDKSADIKLAAKRIVFGKYLNCGQTCVAPDYILCDAGIKDKFIECVVEEIEKQFGKDVLANENYGKIINKKHFDRIVGLIDKEKVVLGGKTLDKSLQIEPTVMDNVTYDDKVMQEEIFGPIMPILTFTSIDEVICDLNKKDSPLALYIFSRNKKVIKKITARCSYGGGCVNDVVIHLATSNMGFGGVGASGMGSYHGKVGFDTFTHYKSIVDKKNWIDLPMRYQSYKKFYRMLLNIFLR